MLTEPGLIEEIVNLRRFQYHSLLGSLNIHNLASKQQYSIDPLQMLEFPSSLDFSSKELLQSSPLYSSQTIENRVKAMQTFFSPTNNTADR